MSLTKKLIMGGLIPLALLAAASTATRMSRDTVMAGEVTESSVILQARLNATGRIGLLNDVAGRAGKGAFELSRHEDFSEPITTEWMSADAGNDYIVKTKVNGLEPGARYYYRLLSGQSRDDTQAGPAGTFKTLGGRGDSDEVKFTVVTGMNRFAFRHSESTPHKNLGFPALEAMVSHSPDFMVATGDNVYYDRPPLGRARTLRTMRAKWHRQFVTPRFDDFFRQVPVYWQKDDHDFRYDDADPYGPRAPSPELGAAVFLEQVPVTDPADPNAKTYRTLRVNDLLQIWLLEGRDYRDANMDPPGPDKSIWGVEQKAWFKKTLLASDALYKIVISPTALIGPDDAYRGDLSGPIARLAGVFSHGSGAANYKRDNHTNPYGFKDEGEEFFAWLKENGFLEKNFFLVCGDRHWQYHSIRPDGFEEFSSGALVDGNSRLGHKPGDPDSTDPDGLLTQPYTQDRKSGGFLLVDVKPGVAVFSFYDTRNNLLYTVKRPAKD